MVFKPKKEKEKANDNENKQINPTSETPLKPEELLTPHLRKEENAQEKQKEKEEHAQQVLQQQSQKESDEHKQNEGHHSALHRYSKWLAVLGGVLSELGVVMFAAGFSAFEILVIDLASIAFLLPSVVAALIVVKQEVKRIYNL